MWLRQLNLVSSLAHHTHRGHHKYSYLIIAWFRCTLQWILEKKQRHLLPPCRTLNKYMKFIITFFSDDNLSAMCVHKTNVNTCLQIYFFCLIAWVKWIKYKKFYESADERVWLSRPFLIKFGLSRKTNEQKYKKKSCEFIWNKHTISNTHSFDSTNMCMEESNVYTMNFFLIFHVERNLSEKNKKRENFFFMKRIDPI